MTNTRSDNKSRSQLRLVAALCYLFTPVVPLTVWNGGPHGDPFLRKHARQGGVWALPFLVLLALTTIGIVWIIRQDILFICGLPVALALPFLPGAYWAKKVYFGGDVTFPGVQVPE